MAGVTCPYCGGNQVRQITPGEFECVTPHPAGLVPPGPGGFAPMRPCTHRFQIATTVRTAPCSCGRESIGKCNDCGKFLCGLHGTGSGEFLCAGCQQARQEQRFALEAQEEHDRQIGLVDFRGLVTQATGRRQATGETTPALDVQKVPFGLIWERVTQAILARNPSADIMVVDDLRAAELPERWPKRGGERKRRRVEAKWNEAADKLAIPAWDMEASFSSGGGVADTYRRQETPMYFGSNGVLYVGSGSTTPDGTHTGGVTFHTPESVPDVWHEKWGAWGTIDNRGEVATGFANLVVKHSLPIDL